LRSFRASASIVRARRIMGSSEASIALLPSAASRFRSAGSASLLPFTSSAARAAGPLPARTCSTSAEPPFSARNVNEVVSFARSSSG